MQVTNQTPPAAAPSSASAQKPADAAQAPFASLLRLSQSAQAAPADATASLDAEPAASAEPELAPDAEAPATPNTPNTPFKGRLKVTDKATAPRTTESSMKAGAKDATSLDAANDKAEGLRTKHGEAPIADPALAPWLAALQHRVAEAAPAALGKAASGAAPAGTDSTVTSDMQPATKPDAASMTQDKPAPADTKAGLDNSAVSQAPLSPWLAATGSDSAAAQHLVEDTRSVKSTSTDATPSAAALGAAAFNPLLGRTRDGTAPLAVNLPTPLASPEFAQALGVQMSVLAVDGVQHAELQLNPAEMGPVSVQIVIDGTNAQVDFGADLAATRKAIEAGLPELAGALRDAGFTLTGGGVSQHSGSRGGSQDEAPRDGRTSRPGDGARRSVDASSVAAGAARQRRTVTAGGVDLYA